MKEELDIFSPLKGKYPKTYALLSVSLKQGRGLYNIKDAKEDLEKWTRNFHLISENNIELINIYVFDAVKDYIREIEDISSSSPLNYRLIESINLTFEEVARNIVESAEKKPFKFEKIEDILKKSL